MISLKGTTTKTVKLRDYKYLMALDQYTSEGKKTKKKTNFSACYPTCPCKKAH